MPPLLRAVRAVLFAGLPAAGLLAAGLLALPTPQPALAAEDRWRVPLDGQPRVARQFAPPAVPYGPGHRGVDLLAPAGAVVRAAGDGIVGYAGWLAGRPVVTVVHGELRTTYEPVSPAIRVGARVAMGDVVGHLVAEADLCPTADVTCLHWGLRRGSAYLNPLALLRRVPLRLLPLTAPASARPPLAGPAVPLPSARVRPMLPPPGSDVDPGSSETPSPLLLAPLAAAGAAAVILAVPQRATPPAPGADGG